VTWITEEEIEASASTCSRETKEASAELDPSKDRRHELGSNGFNRNNKLSLFHSLNSLAGERKRPSSRFLEVVVGKKIKPNGLHFSCLLIISSWKRSSAICSMQRNGLHVQNGNGRVA
jgi:hypothetical protein